VFAVHPLCHHVADIQVTAQVRAEASGPTLDEIVRIDDSFVEVRNSCLTYELTEPLVTIDAAVTAPDPEPEVLEAEEGVTILWEVSR
jgi:hypothetical protein